MENEMDRTEIEKGAGEMYAVETSAVETDAVETPASEMAAVETFGEETFDAETSAAETMESGNVDTETVEADISEREKGVKSKLALLVGIGILIFALSFLYGMRFFQPDIDSKLPDVDSNKLDIESKQLDANPPPFGWEVTEDLGVGDIPGGPTAQRFVVEHDTGWEVLAYCLEPNEPPPPVGTACELIDADTFWCGDDFQQLREYEILKQPPAPEQTETVQPSATYTSTFTPTSTPTSTPTVTNTATSTATTKPTNISAAAKTSTPTPRPKMGGDGNLRSDDVTRFVLGLVFISISGILTVVEGKRFLTQRHKK